MPTTLIGGEVVRARVLELAGAIRHDLGPGAPIHLVAVLKGAFVFLADLIRAVEGPVSCDFLAVSSYGSGQTSSGEVRVIKDLEESLEGRHVVIVEDIVESGLTLSYLQTMLRARRPQSLRTVCLLDKRSKREIDVTIDYVGFVIEDRFVVGYGLDLDGQYRNLPDVAVLDDDDRS
jgi:hypoxanthine phosphoribosyltransferase